MRPPPDLPPVDCLVIWQPYRHDPSLPWWWRVLGRRLVKPGFAHVLVLFAEVAANAWIVVDPVLGGLPVRAVPLTVTFADLLRQYPGTTYCLLEGRRRDRYPARTRLGLTCVTVVAAILGLDSTPLTPWRLYRHVKALADAEAAREEPRPDGRPEGGREGRQGAAGAAAGAR